MDINYFHYGKKKKKKPKKKETLNSNLTPSITNNSTQLSVDMVKINVEEVYKSARGDYQVRHIQTEAVVPTKFAAETMRALKIFADLQNLDMNNYDILQKEIARIKALPPPISEKEIAWLTDLENDVENYKKQGLITLKDIGINVRILQLPKKPSDIR